MATHDPDERADPGLLQHGGHDDDCVQVGAGTVAEHLPRRADLLAGVGPARRRFGVPDLVGPNPGVDRLDDVVHPLRSGLVALDRRAAGPRLQPGRDVTHQRRHGRVVRHDMGGEHLQCQRRRLRQPLVRGQHDAVQPCSAGQAFSRSRICRPYFASLFSPTPLTMPSAARVAGASVAI